MNEVKAVKVAVLAALRGVSATPHSVSATQDTHWNCRGLEGHSEGGGVLYMKKFYGLELLKNHF